MAPARATDEIYSAAIADVRGQASLQQVEKLERNPRSWVEALQLCLDNVDTQFDIKEGQFQDEVWDYDQDSGEYEDAKEALLQWRADARTFRKHVSIRLRAVQRKAGTTPGPELLEALAALWEADQDGDEEGFEVALEDVLDIYERDHHDSGS